MKNRVWEGFIQLASCFEWIDGNRYILKDQFGNTRYIAYIFGTDYCEILDPRREYEVIESNKRFSRKFIKKLK